MRFYLGSRADSTAASREIVLFRRRTYAEQLCFPFQGRPRRPIPRARHDAFGPLRARGTLVARRGRSGATCAARWLSKGWTASETFHHSSFPIGGGLGTAHHRAYESGIGHEEAMHRGCAGIAPRKVLNHVSGKSVHHGEGCVESTQQARRRGSGVPVARHTACDG